MRRRGFTLWHALKLLAVVASLCFVACGLFVFPHLAKQRHWQTSTSCQTNLRQVALGFKQYLQDYNGTYPIIKIHNDAINYQRPFGWADSLQPYLKASSIFFCPKRSQNGARQISVSKPYENEYTDYWFNRRVAGRREKEIRLPASTILLGDGNDGTDATNARYSLNTLPAAWRADKNSPAYRHLEGANYAFADGHVKWLKPMKVTDKKPGGEVYTFAIK